MVFLVIVDLIVRLDQSFKDGSAYITLIRTDDTERPDVNVRGGGGIILMIRFTLDDFLNYSLCVSVCGLNRCVSLFLFD